MDPPLRHWLVVYSLWFVPEVSEAGEIDTGIRGILLNRRNIPIMSMPIESMLLAVNSNFLVFSVSSDDMMGQSFASLVSTVAAAESAIGVRAFLAGRAHPILKSFPKPLPVQLLKDRDKAIQEESQQFPNPNEVVPPESNEQQRLLRISLRICGTVVESLPMARCAPKCEKTVQAFLCRNLNVKSATLPNATSSRRIRLQDDLVTGFHFNLGYEAAIPKSELNYIDPRSGAKTDVDY
ncbi:UNVERIFIED_CONTAM: ATP synthase protein MI25 [Sesamum calycinum]|uniref:ATP synthase protein MI25 n=1 Tax=Sesamum calycinum TaxID=2727403 RepID=A0AAW2JIT8_9LAMI